MNLAQPSSNQKWYLDRIYVDFSKIKAQINYRDRANLSDVEWLYLQDMLTGASPAEIAARHNVKSATVRCVLCEVIYPCLRSLYVHCTGQAKKVRQWSDVPLLLAELGYGRQPSVAENTAIPDVVSCWEGAPKLNTLVGRDAELADLQQWLVKEQNKIVMLTGLEGIGKTALARCLAESLAEDLGFAVIWISMAAAPSPTTVLEKIQRVLGSQPIIAAPTLEEHWSRLLQDVPQSPWLVVLDGMETTLENHKYTTQHQNYRSLFRQVCETSHQGQFLLTSSQSITNLFFLEEKGLPVRLCKLKGLSQYATGKLLEHLNVECKNAKDCEQVRRVYNGNPQFIRFLATSILEIFDGKLTRFTELNTILLDDQMQLLLDIKWQRFSSLEKQIVCVLSDAKISLPIVEIREKISPLNSTGILINGLKSLKECEFIEQVIGKDKEELRYQLRPLIRKYLTDYLN